MVGEVERCKHHYTVAVDALLDYSAQRQIPVVVCTTGLSEEQLAKIISESAGVIDEKSLRTWDSEDVLAVYDSLVRAHESINKLALVPESF